MSPRKKWITLDASSRQDMIRIRTKSSWCTRHTPPELRECKQGRDRDYQYLSSLAEPKEYTSEHDKEKNEGDHPLVQVSVILTREHNSTHRSQSLQ
jgi:hypothetical protein